MCGTDGLIGDTVRGVGEAVRGVEEGVTGVTGVARVHINGVNREVRRGVVRDQEEN
jgi:hypothetical protein